MIREIVDSPQNGSVSGLSKPRIYPISHLVNWYIGNYCTRKCFDDPIVLSRHYEQLREFATKNPGLEMTHADFKDFFNDSMIVCTLDDSFKRKSIGWSLFSILQRTPGYCSKDIIVLNGKIEAKQGPLPAPVKGCAVCRKLGVRL